jgi:hypothetical protein
MKKFVDALLVLFHLYIKFQDQNHINKIEVKKIKFLTDLIFQIC